MTPIYKKSIMVEGGSLDPSNSMTGLTSESQQILEQLASDLNLPADQLVQNIADCLSKIRCSEAVLVQELQAVRKVDHWQHNHFQLLCSELLPLNLAFLDQLLNALNNAMNLSETN